MRRERETLRNQEQDLLLKQQQHQQKQIEDREKIQQQHEALQQTDAEASNNLQEINQLREEVRRKNQQLTELAHKQAAEREEEKSRQLRLEEARVRQQNHIQHQIAALTEQKAELQQQQTEFARQKWMVNDFNNQREVR